MEKKLIINTAKDMVSLGEKIGEKLDQNMIITLIGDLGAGKTTLTKGIAFGLGINDIVNSPTFTIMKTYQGKYSLHHLDVFRIDNPDDDFELEEYIDYDGISVIEWANNIKSLLPSEVLEIEILRMNGDKRQVILKANDERYMKIINEVCK